MTSSKIRYIEESDEHLLRIFCHHGAIDALLLALQLLRTTELEQLALIHHHDLAGVFQGRQAMGDCQDCTILEFLPDDFLDESVVLDVDVGGGLVNQDDLAVLQEGSANTQELLLAS